jgi:hypothetical protein
MIKEYLTYLKNNPHGYWFKRKLYGWGWTPATWQGWLTIGMYVLLIIAFSLLIPNKTSSVNEVLVIRILPITLLTIVLLRICYRKGEKPKWQWGDQKNKKQQMKTKNK